MDKNTLKTVGIVVALILGIVGVFFKGNKAIQNITNPRENVGAITSPDIPSRYLSVGGVRREYRTVTTGSTATTTPCAIEIPNGTSTLSYFSFQVSSSTGTAAAIDIGTSTTAFSTTTVPMILRAGAATNLAATTLGTFVFTGIASSSAMNATLVPFDPTTGASTNVLFASTSDSGGTFGNYGSYLVVKVGGASFIGGTCKAIFNMVN